MLPWHIPHAAASCLAAIATVAGSATESAAVRKEMKHVELINHYHFFPISIESHGPLGNKAISFLSDLGRRIAMTMSDIRKTSFLFQRISVALKRFNAVCVVDTCSDLLVNDSG